MGKLLNGLIASSMLWAACAGATESSDLLDAFNDISLETPTVAFDVWEGEGEIESSPFKDYYQDQFDQYVDLASRISLRAIACSQGDIPMADGYTAMADLKSLYATISSTLSNAETQLKLWVDLGDAGARDRLGQLIPKLTVDYSRMLFVLSSCSGYLYGELVN